MKITSWSLRHPIPTAVVTVALVMAGLLAFFSLNREFVPSMVLPTVTVVTVWPGADARDVERDVTEILEDRLASLPSLSSLKSTSGESLSLLSLEFRDNVDTEAMLQEVRARVNRAISDLPEGIQGPPFCSSWGPDDMPVFTFAVSTPWTADRQSRYVEDVLLTEIYRVPGVSGATLLGDRRQTLTVTLDVDALSASGIAPLEVFGALQRRNQALPAGLVDWSGGDWAFRVSGEFSQEDQLMSLVVGSAGGQPVSLGDVADITLDYEDPDDMARSGNRSLTVVQVTKRAGGNALDLSEDLQRRLEVLVNESLGAVEFRVFHDDSETVRLSLRSVTNSALVGLLMAVAVIWLFLRDWRSTLAVAVSLPVSLVVALAGMRLAGQTMNILTMAGVTVSLGMVVDASIVVLENISKSRNAEKGVAEVAGAVTASTTTSVSVFAPMIFLTGIIGIVMKDLSLSLVLCLTSSLAAALFLVPPLARWAVKHRVEQPVPVKRKRRLLPRLENSYRKSLERTIGMPWVIVIASVAILMISVFSADLLGLSFIPSADSGDFSVILQAPPGTPLEETARRADIAESIIRERVPEITDVLFLVGHEDENGGGGGMRESAYAKVLLTPPDQRNRDVFRIMADLRGVLPQALPGSTVRVLNGGFDRLVAMGTGGAGFRVELTSPDLDALSAAADRVEALLAADPEIDGTGRDIVANRRTITALLDGDAMGQLGVDPSEATLTASLVFQGMDAGSYRPTAGLERDMRVTSNLQGQSPDAAALSRVPLRTATGNLTTLDAVAHVQDDPAVSQIRRRDRVRTLTVVGYPITENTRGITTRLTDALENQVLADGVEWNFEGVSGLIGDSVGKLAVVLLVALFLVYAVMAIQFERLIQPLIIMASVPFCFIGVVAGLGLFGSNLSIVSFLGIVALGGIVVNNAIVQVDRINQLREIDGLPLDEAIVAGASSRLRPILMTTLTTFFGVLPLSLARGAGAQIYAPLGQAIAGGLVTSTLVTLFLVPSLYRLVERHKEARSLRNADSASEDSTVA